MDDSLDLLNKIGPVDPPPFLLTRIRASIEALGDAPAPVQWKWAFAITALMILILNTGAWLVAKTGQEPAALEVVATSMHLSNSNVLYHD